MRRRYSLQPGASLTLHTCEIDFDEHPLGEEEQDDPTEELGSEINIIFAVDAPPVRTEDTIAAADVETEQYSIPLIADAADHARFCARVDARTNVRPGGQVRLSVDPARFHFFDPATGRAIESNRAVAAGVSR